MVSEFRKKKLLFVFNVFFDINQSGTIDKKDFDIAIQRICESRGWGAGTPKAQSTTDTLVKVWEGLKARADADNDGQVSREEWITMWDDYAKNPTKVLEWQQIYMNFMFELEDASGDGSIDEEEFSRVVSKAANVSEAEAKEAFKKLGVGKEITRQKFGELWKQFFSSDDPSSNGNFIFGKTSF